LRGSAQAAKACFPALEPKHLEHAEASQADDYQIDGDDEIQEPGRNQDQDPREKGDDRGNVRGGDGH
jgi:hypothetical protein